MTWTRVGGPRVGVTSTPQAEELLFTPTHHRPTGATLVPRMDRGLLIHDEFKMYGKVSSLVNGRTG